jgi:hypothetical protein
MTVHSLRKRIKRLQDRLIGPEPQWDGNFIIPQAEARRIVAQSNQIADLEKKLSEGCADSDRIKADLESLRNVHVECLSKIEIPKDYYHVPDRDRLNCEKLEKAEKIQLRARMLAFAETPDGHDYQRYQELITNNMFDWFDETKPTPEEDAERNELEKRFEPRWRPGTPEYAERVHEERAREEELAINKAAILEVIKNYP